VPDVGAVRLGTTRAAEWARAWVAIGKARASFVDVMSGSWRLILPGRRYVPPAAPDDAVAVELRSLARRDLAAGRTPRDWSDDERERLLGDRRRQRALMDFYDPVRWPDRVLAPPAVTDEGMLITIATVFAALAERKPDALWAVFAMQPMWGVYEHLEQQARRRSAARLGLTAESLPRRATISGSLFIVPLILAPWVSRRLQGETLPASMPWSVYLASRIVAAIDERRSWRRALRR
jgi:hypothetical protein